MLDLLDVTCRYGDLVALDQITFSVAPGQIMGFVGRNGAGKTTAMRAILGLVEHDEGTVRWHGKEPDHATRARRFGYLPEERGLYPKMRIDDQLRFLGRASGMASAAAAEAATSWLHRLGLGDRAQDTLDELSLGNQQRVQLAASILHRPELLVLDEPFSGLDPVGVDVLVDALRDEVGRGAAVLFSSHQLELVERLCDSVVIIEAGRITASGTLDELRNPSGRRRYEVELSSATDGWATPLPGVEVIDHRSRESSDRWVLELTGQADDQDLLDAARDAGTVHRFGPLRTSLADRYRETIDQ